MTDRHAGYVVTLAADIREDDAEESVLTAIRMIRGVIAVEPVLANAGMQIEAMRRDNKWRTALLDLIAEIPRQH